MKMDSVQGRAAPCLKPSHVWTPAIVTSVAPHLPAQEVGNLRFVDKATSVALQEQIHVFVDRPISRTVFLTLAGSFIKQWSAPGACKGLTLAQKRQLLSLGANGSVATLKVARKATGLSPAPEDLEAAAGAGAMDCCRKIYRTLQRQLTEDRQAEALRTAFYAAACGGQQEACEWCLASISADQRGPEACVAAAGAARGGHEQLASWLLERAEGKGPGYISYKQGLDLWLMGCSLELGQAGAHKDAERRKHLICVAALEGCSLDGVERLLQAQGGPPGPKAFAMGDAVDSAVSSPTPDWEAKVRWALARGGRLRATAYTAVITKVRNPKELLMRLTYLEDHNCRPDSYALDTAVAGGHLAAVEWLIGRQGSAAARVRLTALCCRGAMLEAAKAGHLDVLRALHSAGCILPPRELALAAASGGRLKALQWAWEALEEEEKANTAAVFTAAAGADRNSVEAMRWLATNGCRVSEKAWIAAEEAGCEAALELLAMLRCPKPQR